MILHGLHGAGSRVSMPRMKHTILVAILVVGALGTAHAGGEPGSIGVGAEAQLSGLGGISVNYDAGKFHTGGFLGFADPPGGDNTQFDIGGRFFFHLASTAMSDFSVGGSLGIAHSDAGDQTNVFLEPSFQIRAFLASNVALSFTGGITIGTGDNRLVEITAQVTGAAGVHYYF
jgi:hypothetical protein